MSSAPIPWKHLRNTLVIFAPLWLGAPVVFGILGAGYALLRSDLYAARQPVMVRDEATNAYERLGRFTSQTDLKAAQETILEMTQNPEVVAAALRTVGPPPEKPLLSGTGQTVTTWPSTEVVDSVRSQRVNLLAPKGSEFGNTEVVYLYVEAESQQRAKAFCRAMFDNLTDQLRTVRKVRADSVIEELSQARDLARQNLDEASARLHTIELEFATDLGELRSLNDSLAGDGTNRRTLEQTKIELQAAELELEKRQALHQLLVKGSEDPQQLLSCGADLLASQPALQRLKEGLVDAQLNSSHLVGVYTEENPKLRAAIATEEEIKRRMRQETAAVIDAMKPILRLERDRIEQLRGRMSQLQQRLDHLAKARTEYAKIDAEVRHRTEALAEAEQALTDAIANRNAALSTSLIAELGPPQVSEHPVGMSGALVTAGSMTAGLIFGLGTVFLIAPGPTSSRGGRRWSDFVGAGRRESDRVLAAVAGSPPGEGHPRSPRPPEASPHAAAWPETERSVTS